MSIEFDDALNRFSPYPTALQYPQHQQLAEQFFKNALACLATGPSHLNLAAKEIVRLGKISSAFQTAGTPLPPDRRIGVIPGINNLPEEAHAHAERISRYAQGHSIEGIDNSSHSPLIDAAETLLLSYQGIPTPPAYLCREQWTAFHKENEQNPDAKYLQICHSQGAVHVKQALLLSSPEIRNRVVIVAIAPAAVIPKRLCHDSYNYASNRDFVPYGEFVTDFLCNPIKAVQDFEDLKELIWIDSSPEASAFPKIDHDFNSPTFAEVIKRHVNEYLQDEEQ